MVLVNVVMYHPELSRGIHDDLTSTFADLDGLLLTLRTRASRVSAKSATSTCLTILLTSVETPFVSTLSNYLRYEPPQQMNVIVSQMVLRVTPIETSIGVCHDKYASHSINDGLHGCPHSFLKFTR